MIFLVKINIMFSQLFLTSFSYEKKYYTYSVGSQLESYEIPIFLKWEKICNFEIQI